VTAAELYAADPGFRALLRIWTRRRHCPEVLIDYLMDREMYGPAECARWAFTTPKRPVFVPIEGERSGMCHPYPGKISNESYGWVSSASKEFERQCFIPFDCFDPMVFPRPLASHYSAALAIVALMDAWIVPNPEIKTAP
jgi:hypothetical protein